MLNKDIFICSTTWEFQMQVYVMDNFHPDAGQIIVIKSTITKDDKAKMIKLQELLKTHIPEL